MFQLEVGEKMYWRSVALCEGQIQPNLPLLYFSLLSWTWQMIPISMKMLCSWWHHPGQWTTYIICELWSSEVQCDAEYHSRWGEIEKTDFFFFLISNETDEKQTCAQQRTLWLPHGYNSHKCTSSCPYLLHSVLDVLLLTFALKKKKIIWFTIL